MKPLSSAEIIKRDLVCPHCRCPLINQNEFGNGTAIFTKSGHFAREFARKVQVGMVGVNVPIPVPVGYHTFGGWKHSIFGDVHMHAESIYFYTKTKTVTTRWGNL